MEHQTTFKIFVGGLSKKATESRLKQNLQKFGNIRSVEIRRKKATGDCLGYGHITVNKDTYFLLINKGCTRFMGRRITFGPFLEGNHLKNHLEKLNSKRIFVRNIPRHWTSSLLEEFFSTFGVIESAYLRSIPGAKKAIGVVLFINPVVAEEVVQRINGDLQGQFREMTATYKFFHKRSESSQDERQESEARGVVNRYYERPAYHHKSNQKPGKKGYHGYTELEKNHNFENLILNVGQSNSKLMRFYENCEYPECNLVHSVHPYEGKVGKHADSAYFWNRNRGYEQHYPGKYDSEENVLFYSDQASGNFKY